MKRMSFDDLWDYLPEKWQWVAQLHLHRDWYVCQQKPVNNGDYYFTDGSSSFELPLSLDYDGPWDESLHERPQKKVMVFKTKDSIVLSMPEYIAWDGPFPDEAPPEVAEWFRKVIGGKE